MVFKENSKSEYRNPKQIRMTQIPNQLMLSTKSLRIFEFWIWKLFRHSNFGFRIFLCSYRLDFLGNFHREFEGSRCLKSRYPRFASGDRTFNERKELLL